MRLRGRVLTEEGRGSSHLGVASAALPRLDDETAGRGYWEARARMKNAALEQPLSAALAELGRITGYPRSRPPR